MVANVYNERRNGEQRPKYIDTKPGSPTRQLKFEYKNNLSPSVAGLDYNGKNSTTSPDKALNKGQQPWVEHS